MLKWAVNQPRPSYLAEQPDPGTDPAAGHHVISSYSDFQAAATPMRTAAPQTQRLKLKRQSLLPGLLHLGKENQLTSTPLPAAGAAARTPLLRDLSNIMSPLHTPMTTTMPTSVPVPTVKAKPAVYASTLPTFEAEYSPSYRVDQDGENNNVIFPGALLALRGMGIPDSYFEKPRYLEQKPLPSDQVGAAPPAPSAPAGIPNAEQTTLSSSQMGDVTLERMIDAILESTRKPPARVRARTRSHSRLRQRPRQRQQPQPQPQRLISTSHSPTYRPAFDPASDLCEYWQPPVHPDAFEEREVCSPQPLSHSGSGADLGLELGLGGGQGKRRSLQLRRQRVVRRKRQIATKISSSVRQSAQKLLAAASRSAQKLPHSRAPSHCQSQPRTKQRHISPDSGHNSTSDCELDEELEAEEEELARGGPQLEAIWLQSEARDATKRRLSFSLNEQS